uniref:ATP synthase subunit a n=1 Tax=Amblyomma testudinarium TaxID=375577 RepID=A0A7R6VSD8_AMBTS|nr:ATP synthase F0 subunit 6 [Amblyomma testudinarium]UNO54291.1 ATP synthase F0 subunit 6 [Amblyomma testudinarium]BCG44736.1 ATP synthase subunit 6 [Amblyomma testudinarium]BCG67057.1 ATP synthase subunit 6 [Amblyomma testudinarium]BCG67070.1 ATP synthase subunit 6 [Amblyomma testudinarium]BCG67109.1 ATP synthase subunit 6 [Amblyomma testudinarium]
MMNNLFSIFDPSTSMNFSSNWFSLIFWISLIPFPFWITSSLFLTSWKILFKKLFNEVSNNVFIYKKKNLIFLISVMFIILFSNFLGLFPYIFTPSSHLIFTMFYAFSIWISLMIFSILNKFNKIMTHLVPLGSPIMLSFFMVLIETVSNLIRPITLSVRLTANMISGHLLIHLLSSMMLEMQFFMFMIIIMVMLLILETAVAFIQSYVFMTLISLYINEV